MLGAHTLVTVSPVGMERLLRLNGFRASRGDVPMKFGSESITSLVIDLSSIGAQPDEVAVK
jgi:N-acyl-L-homoserine lactone synthetase